MDAAHDPGRKLRHLDACLAQDVEYRKSTGFADYEFENEALPEASLAALDLATAIAGKPLRAPLMIAPMTGGTLRGHEINRRLAAAAEEFGLAFGVGSQRISLEHPESAGYFQVRDVAPTVPLFANFGAAQLARGYGAEAARRAVAMIGADALFVHLNAVQEAVKDGDRDFRDVARSLTRLCRELEADGIPVFAREVCFGMTTATAVRLVECGVAGIDCAGAGGTSWAKVEARCATNERTRVLGEQFGEWGIPTSQSIRNVRRAAPALPLIASGGLRNGLDLAKAIALGADLGGMARPFLLRAVAGEAALREFLLQTLDELRICMFATGAVTVAGLRGKVARIGAKSPGADPGARP